MAKRMLILHNIRSTHNVGSIFRTADGFGIDEILLSGYTPYPRTNNDSRLPHIADKLTMQIHKTALGAENSIAFRFVNSIDDAINIVRAEHIFLIALEQSPSSISLPSYDAPDSYALLLGEEVHGIPASILEYCDVSLEIPMCGEKESFNVSVVTGIALYALTAAQPHLRQAA